MPKKMQKLFFIVMVFSIAYSCTPPPIFDEVPAIEWVRFTNDTIYQFVGRSSLVIGFTDGDGDLGKLNDNDSEPNMLIIDGRTNDTIFYQIPNIPRQGSVNSISGEIEVDLSTICCIDPGFPILCPELPGTVDSLFFRVRIRDQAENWSNEIETAFLRVRCFSQ